MIPQQTTALLANQGVGNALALHSQGVDRADPELLAAAYHCDASVDYGFFKGQASKFIPLLCEAQSNSPLTLHRSCAPWVLAVSDHRQARSETYVIAAVDDVSGSVPLQRLIGGRYLDHLSYREGKWGIDHRRYVLDWNFNREGCSAELGSGFALATLAPRGGCREGDPGRALLALGLARPPLEEQLMTPSDQDEQLRQALARVEIRNLLMAYARGADRADGDLLASIFHPGATVVSGAFNGSGSDFAREITGFIRANLTRCFHSIANEWVSITGNRAVGEAYVIAHMTAADTDTLTGGRYIDEFECRDGVWKVTSHTFVSDWNMNLPSSYQDDGMYAALDSRGCYGSQDPVYSFWN